MAFMLRNFVENPTISKLESNLTKSDWRHLAQNYNIFAPSSLTKQELKETVVKGLVELEILSVEAYRLLPQASSVEVSVSEEVVQEMGGLNLSDGETEGTPPNPRDTRSDPSPLNRSVISLEVEKIRLERERLEWQERMQERELEQQERREIELRKQEQEREIELRKQEQEREKELRKQEQEREIREIELRKQELELRKQEMEHQLELAKLGKETKASFQLHKQVNSVPNFNEADPEYFFRQFERLAEHLGWPEEEWVWLIQSKLEGTAAKVFNSLEEYTSYEFVKKKYFECISSHPRVIQAEVQEFAEVPQYDFC